MNSLIDNENVLVSLVIVFRNEEKNIETLLQDYLFQDFPHKQVELILVDGESSDNTKKIALNFLYANSNLKVRLLLNPKRILSTGINIALKNAKGSIILRVDGHARLPPDFIRNNVERIRKGESICGGFIEQMEPYQDWEQLIRVADSSRFGGSTASFRNPGITRYVDTLAYAAYKREVFAKVGGFDERLVRNQDNEIHYRMKKAGYKFFFDPVIHSTYIGRNTLRSLLVQKFRNGFWMGPTLSISPFCFRIRHFIPFFFTLAVVISGLLPFLIIKNNIAFLPAIFLFLMYFGFAILFSFKAQKNYNGNSKLKITLLPGLFLLMHLSYGLGTFLGIIYIPFFLIRTRKYKLRWPISGSSS